MKRLPAVSALLLALSVAACGDDQDTPSDAPTSDPRADAFLEDLTAHVGVADAEVEFEDTEGEGVHSIDVSVDLDDHVTQRQAAEVIGFVFDEAPDVDPGRDLAVHVGVGATQLYVVEPGFDEPALLADALLAGHLLSGLGKVEVGATPPDISVWLPEDADASDVEMAAREVLTQHVPTGVGIGIIAGPTVLSAVDGLDEELVLRWRSLVETVDLADGYDVASVDLRRDPTVEGPGRLAATTEITLPGFLRPQDVVPGQFQDLIWPMVTAQLDLLAEWESGATLQVVNNYTDEPGASPGRDGIIYAIAGPAKDRPDKRGWGALAEEYLAGR